jgi:hypothetical protein
MVGHVRQLQIAAQLDFFGNVLRDVASQAVDYIDMPHWMGGLPPDAPPRPGTPAYHPNSPQAVRGFLLSLDGRFLTAKSLNQ